MISWHDLYTVLSAMVPLYVAMILAYGSVRWWKIFSPDQCSGINRFVAVFAVPLLSFHFISTNNPYEMNFRFIAADTLQKLIMLAALTAWSYIPCLHLTSSLSRSGSGSGSSSGSLEWVITLFSLSTLPNTLVMGIPLLIAMYGEYSGSLMVQVVVLQCIIWYTLLLFLFEYRGARILIMEQFPETAASIVSFKVDSDVVSLDGRDFLETDAEIGDDGKLHVTLRKSNASRRSSFVGGGGGITPRPSNLTGAEIYSLSSSRNPTPRGSNFNNSDFYSMIGYAGPFLGRHSNFGAADLYSLHSSRGPTPRPSNFEEPTPPPAAAAPPHPHPSAAAVVSNNNNNNDVTSPRFGYYPASANPYPTPNPEFIGDIQGGSNTNNSKNSGSGGGGGGVSKRNSNSNLSRDLLSAGGGASIERKLSHDAKELHMFVWSSSASPVSEVGGLQVFGGSNGGPTNTTTTDHHHSGRSADGAKEIRMLVSDHSTTQNGGRGGAAPPVYGSDQDHGGPFTTTTTTKLGGSDINADVPLSTMHHDDATCGGGELEKGGGTGPGDHGPKHMPPARVMTRLILIMVWRKLIRNPNTYSSLIGLIWSLVSFRWHVRMPIIIEKSISILSDAGLGMAMFSLGLFMALQPKIIACGNSVATFSMFIRFVTGPAVMAIASIAIGLKGDLLRVAIVQAALPQGIVPFVFAKEYNNHPAILSTGVIFGMLIALPIDLLYYVLLGL